QPAKVTVPHNSTSANCRRLPIARLPPFGYRKVRRTAPAHDRIDCHLTVAPSKARTPRIILFQKCVAEIQPLPHPATVRLPISPQISTPASRTVGPAVERPLDLERFIRI